MNLRRMGGSKTAIFCLALGILSAAAPAALRPPSRAHPDFSLSNIYQKLDYAYALRFEIIERIFPNNVHQRRNYYAKLDAFRWEKGLMAGACRSAMASLVLLAGLGSAVTAESI